MVIVGTFMQLKMKVRHIFSEINGEGFSVRAGKRKAIYLGHT